MEETNNTQKNARHSSLQVIARAFRLSLPVFCGYLFLGSAFGIMFSALGFSPLWAGFTSVFVYAGSGQFALSSMIGAGAGYVTVFLTGLFVNSRHIFYGLSFIDDYKKMGVGGTYMIYSLTDETYSVHCAMKEAGEDVRVWFFVSLFDHIYWIIGSVVGALAGTYIAFDFAGIEFSMTALFAVILVDRIKAAGKSAAVTAVMGGACAMALLLFLGADKFLLPSMALSLVLVLVTNAKKRVPDGEEAER